MIPINKAILLTAAMLGCFSDIKAENSRFVTLTASPTLNSPPFQLMEGEAAEVKTFIGVWDPNNGRRTGLNANKDGQDLDATQVPRVGNSLVIAGPATFSIWADPGLTALATLQITPETYSVNKTLIVPPGTNQVQIALESSTNLVSWATATNGIYGSPETARFFRIRMDNLTSP
jgi:hypothetical protein